MIVRLSSDTSRSRRPDSQAVSSTWLTSVCALRCSCASSSSALRRPTPRPPADRPRTASRSSRVPGEAVVLPHADVGHEHQHQEDRHEAGRNREHPLPVGFPQQVHEEHDHEHGLGAGDGHHERPGRRAFVLERPVARNT